MKSLPLLAQHESLGAKFGEFAGYSMPLYYTKPMEEHHAVRNSVGIFDITHMGQIMAQGEETEQFLQFALTNDVGAIQDGDALYSPICREDGGVLDDLIIYRYSRKHFRIIINAGNHASDFQWLARLAGGFKTTLEDISEGMCLFAVQGPEAFDRISGISDHPPGELGYYKFTETRLLGIPVFLARTGYTGEPGCEMAVAREDAARLWNHLTGELVITPIGLAARDTLRLEACMSLYGHELRAEWNPFESGVGWAVKLDTGEDFMGKASLIAVKKAGLTHRLASLEITGRGIPRSDYPVIAEAGPVGIVTSGAHSPTTGKAIALARIKTSAAKQGSRLSVEIRGKPVEALVVPKPFYKNPHLRT